MGGEDEIASATEYSIDFLHCLAAIDPTGNLHKTIESEDGTIEQILLEGQLRGIGDAEVQPVFQYANNSSRPLDHLS